MGLSKPFAQGDKVLDPILAFVANRTGPQGQASVPVQGETRSPTESKDRKKAGPTIDMLHQQHIQGWEL